MKRRWIVVAAVISVGLALMYWQVGVLTPAVAGDSVITALTAGASVPALDDKFEYVGGKKCKKCHIKEHKSWEESKKAKTFEVLKPGQAAEAKTKAKLDPAKDYTKDAGCLACHTTGYGKPGGYAIPETADEKVLKEIEKVQNVGCESCHGPGSEYIKVFEDIKKADRKYKAAELYAVGLTKIEAAACTGCHNEKSPTYKAFDFEKQKNDGSHELQPLTKRED
jgi:hypothetical protein